MSLGLAPPSYPTADSSSMGPTVPDMASRTAYAGGGTIVMKSLTQTLAEERRASEVAQNAPMITGLAGHVRQVWENNRRAKQNTVEPRMFKNLRSRRGEYDTDDLALIKTHGGSEIFMMLTSVKCRGAGSWLRDALMGTVDEKCWTLDPGPQPELPPQVEQVIQNLVNMQIQQIVQNGGAPPDPMAVAAAQADAKARLQGQSVKAAKIMVSNMETKMEAQLDNGRWLEALDAFIDDITTFPSAIMKGPVIRKKPTMQWVNGQLVVEDTLVLEWERVDPFNIYPSAQASGIDDGDLIERHRLSRWDLNQLIGVDGYDDGAIRAVIEDYGRGGLREWLALDVTKAAAEGKSTTQVLQNPDELIDALQYWGSASGQMLLDWGVDRTKIPDPTKEYQCEVWQIGRWVIKATLNPDPLGRRPYFMTSYEKIPGVFWGNSVADLVADCQQMCNSAARALANNMSIASGPQVWVNVDRLPTGEDVTQMFPWKIWQGTSDPMGSTSPPVGFFQPQGLVDQLLQVYEKFATLADEYSGVPRYMTGTEGTPGAGRTASGLSMMMTNAGKALKQVIGNIDTWIIKPLIERLYYYNMRYSDDPELKGPVSIIARGANALLVKESVAQNRNQFLQTVLQSPIVQQVVPPEGIAALLREGAKNLNMPLDDIVPPPEIVAANMKSAKAEAQQAQQQEMQFKAAMASAPSRVVETDQGPDGAIISIKTTDTQMHVLPPPAPPAPTSPLPIHEGTMPQQGGMPGRVMSNPNQHLMDGTPVTDHFSPMRQ